MKDSIFHLKPWAPRLTEVANSIIKKIHQATPELEVLFMGAAALGLPGKNDIDLDILCDINHLAKYKDILTPVLGEPKESTDKLVAWEFTQEGFEIDAILSDPATSHVPEQLATFEKLKSDPGLLEEYKRLKETCDGMPYSEYEQRKKSFFNERVLAGRKD